MDEAPLVRRTRMELVPALGLLKANLGPAELPVIRYPTYSASIEHKVTIEVHSPSGDVISQYELGGLFFYLYRDCITMPYICNMVTLKARGFNVGGYNPEKDSCWFEERVMENYTDKVTPPYKIIIKRNT